MTASSAAPLQAGTSSPLAHGGIRRRRFRNFTSLALSAFLFLAVLREYVRERRPNSARVFPGPLLRRQLSGEDATSVVVNSEAKGGGDETLALLPEGGDYSDHPCGAILDLRFPGSTSASYGARNESADSDAKLESGAQIQSHEQEQDQAAAVKQYERAQCDFARTCGDGDGLYAPIIFCARFEPDKWYSSFCPAALTLLLSVPILLWLLVLFRVLGSTAEEFFCPGLEMFSRKMGLPERFAGVTLLALGNGAPDVASTVSAIMADPKRGYLMAMGEVTGVAMVSGTLIVGAVAWLAPGGVGLTCDGALIRDVLVFVLSFMFSYLMLRDGEVTKKKVAIIALAYLAYVLVVLAADLYQIHTVERRVASVEQQKNDSGGQDNSEDDDGSEMGEKTQLNGNGTKFKNRYKALEGSLLVRQASKAIRRASVVPDKLFSMMSNYSDEKDIASPLEVPSTCRGSSRKLSRPQASMRSVLMAFQETWDEEDGDDNDKEDIDIAPLSLPSSKLASNTTPNVKSSLKPTLKLSLDHPSGSPKQLPSTSFDLPKESPKAKEFDWLLPNRAMLKTKSAMDCGTISSPLKSDSTSSSMFEELPKRRGTLHVSSFHGIDEEEVLATVSGWPKRRSREQREAATNFGRSYGPVLSVYPRRFNPKRRASMAVTGSIIEDNGKGTAESWSEAFVGCYEEFTAHWSDFMEAVYSDEEGGDQTLLEKFLTTCEMPITVVRKLTIPVPCEDIYCRPIVGASVALSPLWFLCYLRIQYDTDLLSLGAVAKGFIFGVPVAIGLLVCRYGPTGDGPMNQRATTVFTLWGFVISATYLDAVADQVVGVLTLFGTVCHIPPTVMGLTVLAWGNALQDALANITVARKGLTSMAVTASFAGPIFNLNIGLGVGFLVLFSTTGTNSFSLSLTPPLKVGFIFSIINGTLILISGVLLFKGRIPQQFGLAALLLYVAYAVVSLSV